MTYVPDQIKFLVSSHPAAVERFLLQPYILLQEVVFVLRENKTKYFNAHNAIFSETAKSDAMASLATITTTITLSPRRALERGS